MYSLYHLAVVVLVAALAAAGKELPNTHANHHLLHAHTPPSPSLRLPLLFPLHRPLSLALRCRDVVVDVTVLGLVFGCDVSSAPCDEASNGNAETFVTSCCSDLGCSSDHAFLSKTSIWNRPQSDTFTCRRWDTLMCDMPPHAEGLRQRSCSTFLCVTVV